jgi:hypothetical protein
MRSGTRKRRPSGGTLLLMQNLEHLEAATTAPGNGAAS